MFNSFKMKNQELKGTEGTILAKELIINNKVGFSRAFTSMILLKKFSKLQKRQEVISNVIDMLVLLEGNDSMEIKANDILIKKYNEYQIKIDSLNISYFVFPKKDELVINAKFEAKNIQFIKGYKSITIKHISGFLEFSKEELIKALKYLQNSKNEFKVSDIRKCYNYLKIDSFEFKDEKTYLHATFNTELMTELTSIIQKISIENLKLQRAEGVYTQEKIENKITLSLDEYIESFKYFKDKINKYLNDDAIVTRIRKRRNSNRRKNYKNYNRNNK